MLSNEHTNANTDLTEAVVALADGTITTVQIADESIWGQNTLTGMWSYATNAAGYYVLGYQQTQMTNGTYTTNTATFTGNVVGYGTVNVAVDTATTVVDLRNYRTGDTNATVYTGYAQIPTVQNATLWYADSINGAWTGSTMTVAFLLNNVNDVLKNFIVYKTTDYTEIVNERTGQIVGYTMDVVVNGAVVADYELTVDEFNAIQTYGVGLYKFQYRNNVRVNDDIFTAFNEVDGVTASWSAGRISVTYDNAPFGGSNGTVNYTYTSDNQITVLNIGTGVNNFDLVYGRNYSVYVVANGTAAQYIYVIVDTEDVTNTRTETLDKGGYTYTYTVSKSTAGDDRTVCTGRVEIPTETWEERALALVNGNETDGYVLKDGVTLEEAEALRDAAQEVADDPNSTQADAADATKAVNILKVAIEAYENSQTALGTAKNTALANLRLAYNSITNAAERADAQADYYAAQAAINAATTVAGVNKALAEGVAAMMEHVSTVDDITVDATDLVGKMLIANVPASSMVEYLKGEGLSLHQIVAAMWGTGDANGLGESTVIPALVANQYTAEEIFEEYVDNQGKVAADIAGYLKTANVTAETILDGYKAYLLTTDLTGGAIIVTANTDGTYAFTVDATKLGGGVGSVDTNLFDVAEAAGLDVDNDAYITWDGGEGYRGNTEDNPKGSYATATDNVGATFVTMISNLTNELVTEYTFTIIIGDLTVIEGTMALAE